MVRRGCSRQRGQCGQRHMNEKTWFIWEWKGTCVHVGYVSGCAWWAVQLERLARITSY